MTDENGIRLRVADAEKRDAGKGIARVAEQTRGQLGVLTGDSVVIEGTQQTVATLRVARPRIDHEMVKIDADTRANAGVTVGDEVLVRPQSVRAAQSVTVVPPSALAGADESVLRRVLSRALRRRPITAGERLSIEQVTDAPFEIVATKPQDPVRVVNDTTIRLRMPTGDTDHAVVETDGEPQAGVSYEDIGGLEEELEQVREMIELPLNEPEVFHRLGVEPPKGVLLYGPPGTGKTLIAQAVANEVDAAFHAIDGPEIVSKYKGESEEQLRELFATAREDAPAIIFFDEIDSVAGQRDEDADMETRIVGQLLSLMDGIDAREDVIVIGATNRVDSLDPALRRGGRFDREIEIGVPDRDGRHEILQVHTRRMPLADDIDLTGIAERTHGFVGADIDALTTEAAMTALDRYREADIDAADITVTKADFDAALAHVEPSAMREFLAELPTTTFDDVGGLSEAKQRLREAVMWPLSYDRLFTETATDPPSGILLYGPPGTGKTLLARALAGETAVNFVHVDGPELIDKYVGESEKAIREVFDRARQAAPAIIFFDELDAMVGTRGRGQDAGGVTDRIVSQLLTELDGLRENPNLVVLAATNRKDEIDPALLRPGRLDTHVEIGHPDRTEIEAILAVHTREKPLAEDVALDELSAELTGLTGADVASVVRTASMRAIREATTEYGPAAANERADEIEITRAHFEAAIAEIDPA